MRRKLPQKLPQKEQLPGAAVQTEENLEKKRSDAAPLRLAGVVCHHILLKLAARGDKTSPRARVGDDRVAVDEPDSHVEVNVGRLRAGVCLRDRPAVLLLLLLQHLANVLPQLSNPRVPGEGGAGELLDEVKEHPAVAGLPVGGGEGGAYVLVVDDAAILLEEKVASLVNAHLSKNVPVVVAGSLIRQKVGHREERPGGEPPLDLGLDVVGELEDGLGGHLVLLELIQSLLEVGDSQHGAQGKDLVGRVGLDVGFDQIPGNSLAVAVPGVPPLPGGVPNKGVEEHGLQLGVGDARGSPLLREEGAGLLDVGKVRRVPRLVHQGRERRVSGADSGGVREGGEVGEGGLPLARGLAPGGLGPVAEAV
mmetsp:Transcript_25555/g.64424  ORF Transcript_25555/g.64424 Transcript_25555/m.64424 type:complete len:365 (-) Transcript_25555:1155-2249(-)